MSETSGLKRRQFFYRPPQVVSMLPSVYRWEFTRRHPYYLRHWEQGNRYWQYHRGETNKGDFKGQDVLSHLLVQSLGLNVDRYPDPALDARQDKDFQPPFSDRYATPMTYRQMAIALLSFLPGDVQKAVGLAYLRELAKETAASEGEKLLHAVARSLSRLPRDVPLEELGQTGRLLGSLGRARGLDRWRLRRQARASAEGYRLKTEHSSRNGAVALPVCFPVGHGPGLRSGSLGSSVRRAKAL